MAVQRVAVPRAMPEAQALVAVHVSRIAFRLRGLRLMALPVARSTPAGQYAAGVLRYTRRQLAPSCR
jgi:hypothetical protein